MIVFGANLWMLTPQNWMAVATLASWADEGDPCDSSWLTLFTFYRSCLQLNTKPSGKWGKWKRFEGMRFHKRSSSVFTEVSQTHFTLWSTLVCWRDFLYFSNLRAEHLFTVCFHPLSFISSTVVSRAHCQTPLQISLINKPVWRYPLTLNCLRCHETMIRFDDC